MYDDHEGLGETFLGKRNRNIRVALLAAVHYLRESSARSHSKAEVCVRADEYVRHTFDDLTADPDAFDPYAQDAEVLRAVLQRLREIIERGEQSR